MGDLCLIVLTFLVSLICITTSIKNVEVKIIAPCLDLAFCNLLKGDIAHDNKEFGKDSNKFFKEAEKNIALYLKDNQGSGKKYCTRVYKKCHEDLMEIISRIGSNIPLEDRCAFMDYSYTTFDCKNVQNWPQKVRKVLPELFKHCKIDCSLDFDKTAIPRNVGGKLRREKRAKYGDPNRNVDYWIHGPYWMSELQLGEKIGYFDVCHEGKWSDYTDYENNSTDVRRWVAFGCSEYNPSKGADRTFVEGQIWEPGDVQQSEHDTSWNIRCRDISGTPNNSYIIAIWPLYIKREMESGYAGRMVQHVHYMCANDGSWTKESFQNRSLGSVGETIKCPLGYAVCGVQTRGVETPPRGTGFVTDIRIACCLGDLDHIENFVHKDDYKEVMKQAGKIGYTFEF